MARFALQDFKKQASFFLREKLNDARLVLTDVSRIELLTEEATNEDPWGPETRTMAMLADAAFELEEYERIVGVIHRRLEAGKKQPWRQLYKTLVVLDYLLIHGPNSLGREFSRDTSCVEELLQFNITDQGGIDGGSIVQEKANRVLELLSNPDLRKEELNRARKISFGIQGFGSSLKQEPSPKAVEDAEHLEDLKELYISSTSSSKERVNAAINIPHLRQKRVPYDIRPSVSAYVSSNSLSEERVFATSLPSEGKRRMRLFKENRSSSGYFGERMPCLSWQRADDVINKSEEANICLLDAEEERASPHCEYIQEENCMLVSWPSEVFTDEEEGSTDHGGWNMACENMLDAYSLAENCKSLMQWYGGGEQQSLKFSDCHNLPQPACPKLRVKFEQEWQPPSLIDCDTKFGKAA